MKRMLSTLALLGTFFLLPLVAQAAEYTITIEPVEHATIKVTYGSVSNPTEVHSGDKVGYYEMLTIRVIPDEGYEATHYIVNGVEKPIKNSLGEFEFVREDLTISAKVKPATKCTVTITPPENGTLSVMNIKTRKYVKTGDQLYSGTSIHMSITPAKGYDIEAWLIDGESYEPSDSKYTHYSYTYTVKKDVTISVKLKEISQPTPSDYTVTMIQPKEGQGTMTAFYYNNKDGNKTALTTGSNTVPADAYVTFEVKPAEGYEMDHWMINNKPDESTSSTKGIIVNANLKVEPILKKVGGSAQPTEGKITMVQPKMAEGLMRAYTFDENGDELPIREGQSVKIGTKVTFLVTPKDGYEMDSWKVNDKPKALDAVEPNKIKLTVNGDLKVEPVLKEAEPTEGKITLVQPKKDDQGKETGVLRASYTDSDYGMTVIVNDGDMVDFDTKVTFAVEPAEGYEMDHWMIDDQRKEPNQNNANITEIVIKGNLKVEPILKKKTSVTPKKGTITFRVKGTEGEIQATYEDLVSGKPSKIIEQNPTPLPIGTKVTLKATLNDGYEVTYTNNDKPVAKEMLSADGSVYTFTVEGDASVVATIAQKPVAEKFIVTYTSNPAEGGTVKLFNNDGSEVASGTSIVSGTKMYVEVTPADKYELETLQVGDTKLQAGDEKLAKLANRGFRYDFTVTVATNIQATFKLVNAIEQLTESQVVAYVSNGGTRLDVAGASEGTEVRLYDYTGQLLLLSTEHTLDISALPAGSYIVLVGNDTTRIAK